MVRGEERAKSLRRSFARRRVLESSRCSKLQAASQSTHLFTIRKHSHLKAGHHFHLLYNVNLETPASTPASLLAALPPTTPHTRYSRSGFPHSTGSPPST